jgi:hypothetical protein
LAWGRTLTATKAASFAPGVSIVISASPIFSSLLRRGRSVRNRRNFRWGRTEDLPLTLTCREDATAGGLPRHPFDEAQELANNR